MQKLFIKNKKKNIGKKWTSVWDIQNNGYLEARLKKREREMNKIAHVFLKAVSKFQKRGMFSRSKVELG
jgi:hypothetical protein